MTMTTIQTETERRAVAIRYAQEKIRDLRAAVNLCDYGEDVDGNLVWEPGGYALEKSQLTAFLHDWEQMLSLLSGDLPFNFWNW